MRRGRQLGRIGMSACSLKMKSANLTSTRSIPHGKPSPADPFPARSPYPLGVKDIFDTSDMPTHDGTVLHDGRRPRHDCTAVALLRLGRRGDHRQDSDC